MYRIQDEPAYTNAGYYASFTTGTYNGARLRARTPAATAAARASAGPDANAHSCAAPGSRNVSLIMAVSAFAPDVVPAITARVVTTAFRPECANTTLTNCSACWAAPSPFVNASTLNGAPRPPTPLHARVRGLSATAVVLCARRQHRVSGHQPACGAVLSVLRVQLPVRAARAGAGRGGAAAPCAVGRVCAALQVPDPGRGHHPGLLDGVRHQPAHHHRRRRRHRGGHAAAAERCVCATAPRPARHSASRARRAARQAAWARRTTRRR